MKKLVIMLLSLCMLITAMPAMAVHADEPGITYFTIKFDNYEAVDLKPIVTGEKKYNGKVAVFDFLFKKKTYGLYVTYNGYYGDVADRIFYDESTNDVIIGVKGSEDLKNFGIGLHPSSTGTVNDKVSILINHKQNSMDDNGCVWFKKAPSELIYTIGIGPAGTEKYDLKTIDKSKTYYGSKCNVRVENYATYVALKGDATAVKKINKKLKKQSKAFLKDKTIHGHAKDIIDSEYATADNSDTYYNYRIEDVGFSNDKVISVADYGYWYAGGVSNIFESGAVYDLNTGKQIKDITLVTKQKDLDKLKKTLKKKIEKEGQGYDTSEIDGMKATDFNFYINKNGSVTICFGPYELGFGGWSKTYTVAGNDAF